MTQTDDWSLIAALPAPTSNFKFDFCDERWLVLVVIRLYDLENKYIHIGYVSPQQENFTQNAIHCISCLAKDAWGVAKEVELIEKLDWERQLFQLGFNPYW